MALAGRDKKRWLIVSIAVGAVVGVLIGSVAFLFLTALTWSSLHGGTAESTSYVLASLAAASPLACGMLAGWATHRWLSKSQEPTGRDGYAGVIYGDNHRSGAESDTDGSTPRMK